MSALEATADKPNPTGDPIISEFWDLQSTGNEVLARAKRIYEDAFILAQVEETPLRPTPPPIEGIPVLIRGLRHEAESLRQMAALTMRPYEHVERQIKFVIAENPAYDRKPDARAKAVDEYMRAVPRYQETVDEVAAILAAVKRLEIEADYLDSVQKNYRSEAYLQSRATT